MGCWIVIEAVAMVNSFGEMGESFVCRGREMVFLHGVSSLGISESLIWLSRESPPAWLANSSSESSSSSAGSLSELVSWFLDSVFAPVSSLSKIWILVNGCRNRGNPELESCAIWCQTLLYRQTGIACLFTTLSSLSQNS